jgi:hypothetical protein
MLANLFMSQTMRIMALGHSLHEAQCMAAVIVIQFLVLYIIMGYRIPGTEPERYPEFSRAPVDTVTGGMAGIHGMFPVFSGTAGTSSRTLLQE